MENGEKMMNKVYKYGFWILVGVSILVLMTIRFGIKKELLTPVFWLLIGISFMVLMSILWNVIKSS